MYLPGNSPPPSSGDERRDRGNQLPVLGQHLPALDGLRGIAILLVLFFHYEVRYWPWKTGIGLPGWFAASEGWLGVNLFFVLSGFLITGILSDTKADPNYFRTFYARRTLRIFPLYYGMLFLVFWILPLLGQPQASPVSQAWSWSYLSNIPIGLHGFEAAPGLTGHFWSLAIEEQFYLFWPLLVYRFNRIAMIRICVGCILGALILRIGARVGGLPWHYGAFLTPARLDDLSMGALLALVIRREESFRWLSRWSFPSVIVTGLACLALISWRHFALIDDPVMGTVGLMLFSLCCCAILLHAITAANRSVVSKFWCHSWLRFFGRYSYGIYVYHQLVREFLERRGVAVVPLTGSLGARSLAHAVYLALNFFGVIGVAVLSWHWLESPILKLKSRFQYRSRGASVYEARRPMKLATEQTLRAKNE